MLDVSILGAFFGGILVFFSPLYPSNRSILSQLYGWHWYGLT